MCYPQVNHVCINLLLSGESLTYLTGLVLKATSRYGNHRPSHTVRPIKGTVAVHCFAGNDLALPFSEPDKCNIFNNDKNHKLLNLLFEYKLNS